MAKPFVAVLMGSDSDLPVMEGAIRTLKSLGIAVEARVTSAHRTPEATHAYVKDAEQRGCGVFIAAAGMAAHLAGAVAANTTRPVIGVPIEVTLQGLDALLSTVQMPAGIPVATFAIGDAGAHNAALFVVAMLARTDKALADKLKAFRVEQEEKIKKIDLEGHI